MPDTAEQQYTTNGHQIERRISLGRRAWQIGGYMVVEVIPQRLYVVRHITSGDVATRMRWIDAVAWVDDQLGEL